MYIIGFNAPGDSPLYSEGLSSFFRCSGTGTGLLSLDIMLANLDWSFSLVITLAVHLACLLSMVSLAGIK